MLPEWFKSNVVAKGKILVKWVKYQIHYFCKPGFYGVYVVQLVKRRFQEQDFLIIFIIFLLNLVKLHLVA